MPIYFGKLSILGRENIPKGVPVIFAPNHQNAFLDAILIGANIELDLHYLTRSDVFVSPYIGLLKSLHMMPVYRIRDGYHQLNKNQDTFQTCNEFLQNNKPILIFPEGNMANGHHLRTLSKGTARMAFQAQEIIDADVYIVPTGINYLHHSMPRHRCIVKFGEPIRVRDYQKLYEHHANKAMTAVTADLTQKLKQNLLLPEKEMARVETLSALRNASKNATWGQLRALVEQKSEVETIHPSETLILLFTILNSPAHYLHSRIVKPLEKTQFFASIKYVSGTLLFPIYWTFIGAILWIFTSPKISLLIVFLTIISLFARGELRRRATL